MYLGFDSQKTDKPPSTSPSTNQHSIMQLQGVKVELEAKLSAAVLSEVISYVKAQQPKLWGASKPRDFIQITVLLVLYHDITAIGYQALLKKIQLPYKISDKSLIHNTHVLRHLFSKWARTVIKLESCVEWKANSRSANVPASMPGVNLWTDSSDFKVQRSKGGRVKRSDHSFKLNRPGRRYLVFMDGKSHIRKVLGGYSPKVYDSHAVQLVKPWVEAHLTGGVVVADQHFATAAKDIKGVKFFVPHKKPYNSKKRLAAGDLQDVGTLPAKKKKFNDELAHLRARMEQPFGWIKTCFMMLDKPWREDLDQMDALVEFAFGVYTRRKQI